MRKIFITTIFILCAICGMRAQSDTVTVHVDGTTSLESLMEDYDECSIRYLSITGNLSEDDYAYIRNNILKSLKVLDLKNAEIDSLPKNAFNCTLEYTSSEYMPKTQIILPNILEYVSDNAIALKKNRWEPSTFVITGQYPKFADYDWRNSYPEIILRVSENNLYCKEVEMIHEYYEWEPMNVRFICSSDTTILYCQDYCSIYGVVEGVRIISSSAFENRIIGEGQVTYLPSTLDSIGNRAFYNVDMIVSTCCGPGISHLVCMAVNPPKLGEEVFGERYTGSVYLYVPDESIDLYKNTEGWKNFVKIRPMSRYYPIKGDIKENAKRPNSVEVKYNEDGCVLQLSKPSSRVMVYDVDGTQILNKKITSQAIQLNKSLLNKPYSLAVIAFTDGTTEVIKLKY
ncbi:MAG: hypothetical protein J6J76_01230 [Paraprevotella sp.]|nr:hypothetical protein [Paraprevotella sp.]